MPDAIDTFIADIEATIATAIGKLDAADRAKIEAAVLRAAQHTANGDLHLAAAEAVTIEAILWTEANERGKQARKDIAAAVARAMITGAIAAM